MAEAKWLEVSVTADPEMAEALSEVLSRFVNNGVVVESGVNYNDEEDEGTPFGPVRVYGYLLIDETIEERRQRLEEALWYLGRIQPLQPPAFKTIEDEDWMAEWKKHYHPIPIGEKLLILPAWYEPQATQRVVVKIDPSMAFGTGTHPTTQLCLQAIEKYMAPGTQVIDVGCGSGILSAAALKLGASHVIAVDIDAAAIKATQENAVSNEVSQHLETGLGSVTELLEKRFSYIAAPFVLANILAPVIIRLFAAGLGKLVTPNGLLVLSGILAEQAPQVQQTAFENGFALVEQLQMGEWVAILLRQKI